MTEEEAAGLTTADLGKWDDPLGETDDREDAISSAWMLWLVGAFYFALTLGLLVLVAWWKEVLP